MEVRAYREPTISWLRCLVTIGTVAYLIVLAAEPGSIHREEAVRILPAVTWIALTAALWAIALRVFDLPHRLGDRLVDALGMALSYASCCVLVLQSWNLLFFIAPLLVAQSILIGARYRPWLFYAAIGAQLAVVAATAPRALLSSAPHVIFAVMLMVVLPVMLVRALAGYRAASKSALSARDAQRRFIGMMSHELRSPLHVVLNACRLIDRRHLPASDERLLESIKLSGDALLSLVDDMLDVAAMNAGRTQLNAISFAAHHLVLRIRDVLEVAARAKNITVTWAVDEGIPPLHGPKRHIEQVVCNLGTNAIKYTPPGGRVHVSLHHYAVNPSPGAPLTLVFAITDSGIGIPDAEKKRIFEPFHQVSRGAARKFDGVGLGLHIVKTISERMGGTLSVQDNPEGGTIFSWQVELPRAQTALSAGPEPATSLLDNYRRHAAALRCLVVDDSASNLEIMTQILNRAGHQVTTRSNGEEGLHVMRNLPFDVIFLDIHMPGLSGWDVLRELQAKPMGYGGAPVIVLSASTDEELPAEARALGAAAYLTKPVAIEQVLEVLRRIAPAGQPAAASPAEDAVGSVEFLRELSPTAAKEYLQALLAEVMQAVAGYEQAVATGDRNGVLEHLQRLQVCCAGGGDQALTGVCQRILDELNEGAAVDARADEVRLMAQRLVDGLGAEPELQAGAETSA